LWPEFSCELQVITICEDISDSLDNGARIDDVIIDFSKDFDLVPHDRLLRKITASGGDPRLVVWIREFLLGRTQRVKSRRAVFGGSVLGPLLFLAYVNDICKGIVNYQNIRRMLHNIYENFK
jgi:hypothetical protein